MICGITAIIAKATDPSTVILDNTRLIYSFVSLPGRTLGIYEPDLPKFSATFLD